MNNLMKKANSFIIFDLPLERAHISGQFAGFLKKSQIHSPEWSATATRQKLIAEYWYTYVIGHFAVLFELPLLVIILVSGSFTQLLQYLLGFFISGLISFLVLYLVIYRHYFTSFYLPRWNGKRRMRTENDNANRKMPPGTSCCHSQRHLPYERPA